MASTEEESTAPKRQKFGSEYIETDGKKNVFSLFPREKFDKKFPFYRRPQEIGHFSLDIKREMLYDKSRLRYYTVTKNSNSDDVCFDLSLGFEKMIQKSDEQNELIDNILRWILQHRDVFAIQSKTSTSVTQTSSNDDHSSVATNSKQSSGTKRKHPSSQNSSTINTDFVSWRGCLTRLLCSPYESREGWLLAVTRFNDTFYMCEFDTEEKKNMEANRTDFQKEMCYWGWKFEQYVTADKPDGKPDTSSAVNNCEGYCTVIRTRLNSHSLFFSGEVDCIGSKGNYIELKTSRELYNSIQDEKFKRFKLIKWWAQSFLPGVSKIICGFRDDNGVVRRLQEFNTHKIPDMVKDIKTPWKPNICFNFLDQFLTLIKDTVKVNDPRNVYLFSRDSKSNDITWQNVGPDSEFQFLPQWYVDEFEK